MILINQIIAKKLLGVFESPIQTAEQLPVTVDLREYGLIARPIDIGFMNCGSASAMAASLAESALLYDKEYYKDSPHIKDFSTDQMSVSARYYLYMSEFYNEQKGYYCTQQPEFMLNDALQLPTIQLSIPDNTTYSQFYFTDNATQFNPEVIVYEGKKLEIQDANGSIKDESQYLDPFFKDEEGRGLIILYHTPYFALDGDSPFGQDTADLLKTYLAYGFTLGAQVHIDSDSTYQQFKNWKTGDVFAAPCSRVMGKYENIKLDKMKSKIVSEGFNRIQERIINVVIVGYGKKQGQDVWVVKFPFGPAFGNLGYMYFPILNDTLCMEQYIVTVLPKHWKEGMQKGFFSEQRANSLGLKKIYSIVGLIDQMKKDAQGDLSASAAIDQYTSRQQFSINEPVKEPDDLTLLWRTIIPSYMLASPLQCNFSNIDLGSSPSIKPQDFVNCQTTLNIIFNETESSLMQPFRMSCTPEKQLTLNCANEKCSFKDETVQINWICYNIQHSSKASNVTVNKLLFTQLEMKIKSDSQNCILSQNIVQCTTGAVDYNNLKRYIHVPVDPDGIVLTNLLPYQVVCYDGQCSRTVYDNESKVNETWNCQAPFGNNSCSAAGCTLICQGPDRDIIEVGAMKEKKPRTKMFSEIRSIFTYCTELGNPKVVVCPLTYNMNSTLMRIRYNYSNSIPDGDNSKPAKFGTQFYDFDFSSIFSPKKNHYTYNFQNGRSQVNFTSQINYNYAHLARPTVRVLNMDCYFELSKTKPKPSKADETVVDPKQYNCKLWNEHLQHDLSSPETSEYYVCNYTNIVCSAPIFGYSTSLLQNYSLVSKAFAPLIFTKSKVNENIVFNLAYESIQWDTSEVKVTGDDPSSFHFSPCSLPSGDVYSEYCENVTLVDLNFSCDGSHCRPDSSVEFQFSQTTTHLNITVLENKTVPKIQSNSLFYCKFAQQLECFVDRTDLSKQALICRQGKLDCQGASQTTFFQYSVSGGVAKQETGTSVFTMITTDFECELAAVKDFRNDEGRMQADLLCDIRNTQERFSMASASPDYLVRNANSVDEAVGLFNLEGMNRSFQLIFSIGLITIIVVILLVSTVFALWPGEIKGSYARLANKYCCCDRCRFRCVDYDKFGVPMIVDEDLNAEFANVDIRMVSNAFKSGFGGLNYGNLQRALKRQQEKLASGKVRIGVEKKELKQKLKEQEDADRKEKEIRGNRPKQSVMMQDNENLGEIEGGQTIVAPLSQQSERLQGLEDV